MVRSIAGRLFIGLLLLLSSNVGLAKLILSDQAEISIITLGPYQPELYSVYGHSAIRIHDPINHIDFAYNYGHFDFAKKNFYWNYATGRPMYEIGFNAYPRLRDFYIWQQREIYEQVLNLTLEEKQTFADFLYNNYLPENREYKYHYFFDNCATKLPEITTKVLRGTVTYDLSFAQDGKTIRELMNMENGEHYWGKLGINVCLGSQIDKKAAPYTYLFKPYNVRYAFENAKLQRGDSLVNLVKESNSVYMPEDVVPYNEGPWRPKVVFGVIFILCGFSAYLELKRGKRRKWLDTTFFFLIGSAGWLLSFLWLGTEHMSQYNWNLVWALPFHLPLAFWTWTNKYWVKRLYFQSGIAAVLLIFFMPLIPQELPKELIPLLLTIGLRGFMVWRLN